MEMMEASVKIGRKKFNYTKIKIFLNQGCDMYLFGKYSTYFGPPNLRNFFVLIYKICTYFEKFCTFVLIFSVNDKFLSKSPKNANLKNFSPGAQFFTFIYDCFYLQTHFPTIFSLNKSKIYFLFSIYIYCIYK